MRKSALITGADRGLGLALAEALLEQNYDVFAGRFNASDQGLEKLGKQYPGSLQLVELDVSSDESAAEAARFLKAQSDKLDLLINNAAILGDIHAKITDELNYEEMKQVFNVNSLGSLRVTNAVMPMLLKSEQKLVVNISSEAGSIENCWRESWFAYCMSKAAVNMHSAIVHNELRSRGGQVMVVHPGHVQTYMQGKLDTSGTLTPEQAAAYITALIATHHVYAGDRPAFIDYSGRRLAW
ncbi:SDR family NAD(P)-dependent oxidoreductase [Paenibacillus protaetiae]|uniref:SDR family NAD(P)-dependent oxidoreductase n=1 Tax=Paenibacillus protaetiae TaxID=2509456 RepID=UPI0013ECF72F|nr:SDR family NAD(P)-dependent oxidoreductase [Paenibacillus protaetiae]